MEGCKKDSKINQKLLQTVLDNLTVPLPGAHSLYILSLEACDLLGYCSNNKENKDVSHKKPKSVSKSTKLSRGSDNPLSALFSTTNDLVNSLKVVMDYLSKEDAIRTISLQGNKKNLLYLVYNNTANIVCYDTNEV